MEPYTLNRMFHKRDIIDNFFSVIWTERYYGDSEVELIVPATSEMMNKIPIGTFLGLPESDEVMLLETRNFENDQMKLSGISLLSWLNNRFIRTSPNHEDRYWYLSDHSVGETIWSIIYNMCVQGSPYLNGTYPTGISSPENLAIPGLSALSIDSSGEDIFVGVPFGPVYDAIKEIATTYQIGMQIILRDVTESSYVLGVRIYRGLNRTSGQIENSTIRFSPELDSLTDIKELRSIAALKTRAYVFAPGNPEGLATIPGVINLPGYMGFDLRALQVFADDITTDMVSGSSENLLNILNSRANDALKTNRLIIAVDGIIVPDNQFKYGVNYNLGDIVEIQGSSGLIQAARVTEFVRTKDASGEKGYPTIEILSDIIIQHAIIIPPPPPPPGPPPSGPVLYSLYYYGATFDDGPYAGEDTDYCHLAYADETGKDHFIDQDPNWDQGYGVWSPDYTKVCYTQADRRNISSAAWPRGFDDLTPPLPRNPVDFPGTPTHGSIANGDTAIFNTGEIGQMNVHTTAIPTAGSGSVEFYLNASADLSTGYKVLVTRDVDTTWRFTFTDLNTGTIIWTGPVASYLNPTEMGFTIYPTGAIRFWFLDAVYGGGVWGWFQSFGSVTLPLHSGTYVGFINNSGTDATWGGGAPETISLYSLMLQDKDGSNKIVLREDAFCYPNLVSYDNSMVLYGETSDLYRAEDFRIVNSDGTDDRSIFGPGGYITSGPGFYQGNFSYILQWTPDNKIAIWWEKYDISGDSPYPVLESELRLYEPDGSGDYVVAWDAEAYRVSHGIPQYDSDGIGRTWTPWYNGDVSINGDYITGWVGPPIDTGLTTPEGYPIKINDYIAVVIPCVENATPTFIHANDVSWKNWGLWKTKYQTGGFDIYPPTFDDSDDFNRSSEQLDVSSDWESGKSVIRQR